MFWFPERSLNLKTLGKALARPMPLLRMSIIHVKSTRTLSTCEFSSSYDHRNSKTEALTTLFLGRYLSSIKVSLQFYFKKKLTACYVMLYDCGSSKSHKFIRLQCANKMLSSSLAQVESVHHLPGGQVKFLKWETLWRNSNYRLKYC